MKYIKTIWVCISLSLLCLPSAAQQKPNIVLIVSDDLGYSDLGSYGGEVIQTPNLDRMAREGARLTNFYATGSGCTPSRSGLLTGRYPQRNGTFELFRNNMIDYGHRYTEYEYSVSPERILGTDLREIYIAAPLKPIGYHSGYFGKWDLGQLERYLPLQRGFDAFYGFPNTGIDYYTHERYGVPSMYDGNVPTTEDKGRYSTDVFEEKALEFIEANKNNPFFLFLSFNAPHGASSLDPKVRGTIPAPKEYLDWYPEGKTKAEKKRRSYMGAVSKMDEAIGNVLALLEENELAENTLIIFMSDNGGTGVSDNTPLRGRKAQFYEGGIRVPCIVKWPGKIKPGTVNTDFLSALEIFPTIMAATGAKAPDTIVYDGFDMLPVLTGAEPNKRDALFWEFRSAQAARVDNWKWVKTKTGEEGLFDLSKDIGETRDLSKLYPEILQRVKSKFQDWKNEMDAAEPRGPFKNF